MTAETATFKLSLASRPEIRQAGVGTHGAKRREVFVRDRLWALHFYFWEGTLSFGGGKCQIHPQWIGLTPPGIPLTWHFPSDRCIHYFLHFALPGRGEPSVVLPAMIETGLEAPAFIRRFEQIISQHKESKLRAEVGLWHCLWELSGLASASKGQDGMRTLPGPVETALGIIENEFASPLKAGEIAERTGVSFTHLNRLFRSQFEMTVAGYLSKRRIERARELLVHSNLAVRQIARIVGIPDPQRFNKFVRRHLGRSPRACREGLGRSPQLSG